MTHKQHRPPLAAGHILHLPDRLLLELRVAHGQNLINHQNLGLQKRRYRKPEPHGHSRRIPLHRSVQIPLNPREIDDGIQLGGDFGAGHAHDGAVHEDVFAAGHFLVEACADFQEGGDAAAGADLARGGRGDAGKELQKRRFPRPVLADDAHDLALGHIERNVLQGPDEVGIALPGAVVGLADPEIRVLAAQDPRLPPAVQVVGQSAGPHLPQPVEFTHLVEFDRVHTVSMKLRSTRLKTITARNRVTSMKMVLYSSPPKEKDPQPRQPYLKASKIGVSGFSSSANLNFPDATLSG